MTTAVHEKARNAPGRPSLFQIKAKNAILPRRAAPRTQDLAEMFDVTRDTIYKWISRGHLPRPDGEDDRGQKLWYLASIREVLANAGNRRYKS